MSRVLLTVQRPDDAAEAVRAVGRHAAPGDCVAVVGIPPPLPMCAHWVGLTGVAHCPGLRDELVDEVVGVVRATVEALPATVGVSHHVAQGWRDPCLLARVEAGCFDEIVLVAAPTRRRDRRALEAAALVGVARLVTVEAAAAAPDSEAPAVGAPVYA